MTLAPPSFPRSSVEAPTTTDIISPRTYHRATITISNAAVKKRSVLGLARSSPSLAVPSPRRRVPVTSIFPTISHAHQSSPSASALMRQPFSAKQLRDTPPLIRTGSIFDHVSEEYLRTLNTLFRVCDLNEDGKLTPGELDMMLQLIGLPENETQRFIARRFPTTDTADFKLETIAKIGMTFDQVLKECRDYIFTCAAHTQLPPHTFLVRCKPLKLGFKKCDSDEIGYITKKQLEIALQKLEFVLTDEQLDQLIGILDRNEDGRIEWSDFIFAAWNNSLTNMSATLGDFLSIDIFADLPLLLRPVNLTSGGATGTSGSNAAAPFDNMLAAKKIPPSLRALQIDSHVSSTTKCSTFDDKNSSNASTAITKSRMERMGVDFLTRVSMQRVAQAKRSSAVSPGRRGSRRNSFFGTPGELRKRGSRRNGFSPAVRRRIQQIEALAIAMGSAAGIVSGLVSIWIEGYIPGSFEAEHGTYLYYLCVVLINIGVSLLEVNGMYVTAVVCAFRLTVSTNLTLYPQDAEREFLTRAIARAALQVGHRKDKIFGIDPMKGSPRLALLVSYLMYKSKRYMLKFLLKLFIKRVLWRAVAKSVLSLLVLPINGVMNAWTLRNVMLNCRVSIIGPPCAIDILEVFFLEDDSFAPFQRVDYIRVMGCALVCKRSVHPNLEIMLDHMRHRWIKPGLWPISEGCICINNTHDPCEAHPLDDTNRFVGSLELYASHRDARSTGITGISMKEHLRNVLFLLIVALIIDGNLDWVERRLYLRVCSAARVQKRWREIFKLKDDFVLGKGIHMESVYALIVEEAERNDSDANARLSVREYLRLLWNRISKLLSW